MSRILAAGGAFLLGVLWMDLMFDAQVVAQVRAAGPLPESVLASISAYYRRVTTDAAPLGNLIGIVMIGTVVGAAIDLVRGRRTTAVRVAAFLLCAAPVALALGRVFPNAVELGAREGTLAVQSELARGILREHIACFASMAMFVGIQLSAPRDRPQAPADTTPRS